MTVSKLEVRFLIPVPADWQGREDVFYEEYSHWLQIDRAVKYAPEFITTYLTDEQLSCCSFQGGLIITADGKPWNDYCFDEFWMTMHWYHSLELLLTGQKSVETSVWEESRLKLVREDANLWLSEEAVPDFCPLIQVEWQNFVEQVMREGRYFANWVRAIHQEISKRYSLEELEAVWALRQERGRSSGVGYPVTEIEKFSEINAQIPYDFVEQIEKLEKLL